jgi:hypothetical protein
MSGKKHADACYHAVKSPASEDGKAKRMSSGGVGSARTRSNYKALNHF